MQDVFDFRNRLIDEYAAFSRSFSRIAADDLAARVDEEYARGRYWPEPLIQINPNYKRDGTVQKLVKDGSLHPACAALFQTGKVEGKPSDLHLYKHQMQAIAKAQNHQSYVVTTGTGSGKSLSFFIPVIDRILKAKQADPTPRTRAIVIYPMNALANSQLEELDKFLHGYSSGHEPFSVRRYTGQESGDERKAIADNPPDILLTNFMMLELILTRFEDIDRRVVDHCRGLEFLVLDELHTYRGRQGADVAMLVRRIRERLQTESLVCIGTSATMSSADREDDRNQTVAEVASLLFGTRITALDVIGETLERVTNPARDIAAVKPLLKAAITQPTHAWSSFDAFQDDPLAIWVELNLGIDLPKDQPPRRAKPITLKEAAERLAADASCEFEQAREGLRRFLVAAHDMRTPQGRAPFAFKLHQFISGPGKVLATLEPLGHLVFDHVPHGQRQPPVPGRVWPQTTAAVRGQPRRHFLGTVIVTEHRAGAIGEPTTAEVIDGQQRMTTTQLLALAFRDAVAGMDDTFLRQCMDTYTANAGSYRAPHARYKVWPTNAGRKEMSDLVEARSFEAVCQAYPVVTLGSGKSKKRVPRPLLVEAYMYFYGVISLFLRGVDFDEVEPPEAGSLDALLDDMLLEAGHDVDRTLAARWIREIRHETAPTLPRHELPILPERIQLLTSTLTEYVQLIELRLGTDDDAQVIFESLNDRGERLTPADLVRNFVFLEATRKNASAAALYDQHWRDFDEAPAEKGAVSKSKLFWKVDERQGRLTNTRLDTLLYHYVSMRTMNDVKLDHVFEEFKQWWLAGKKDVNLELDRLKQAAAAFHAMVLPDRSTRLGRFAHNLRVLDSTTVTPVVLFLSERLGGGTEEFLGCLKVLESYLVRRTVCGRPTKAYNRIFPGLLKRLSEAEAPSAALVTEHLKGLSGGETQDWPDDATFQKAWLELNTYKALRTAKTKMLLEALELGSRNDVHHESAVLPSAALHVEHVLPVAWEAHWPAAGDETAVMVRNHLLHNIGNLTLLTAKLNPSLSNSSFDIKRPEITKSLLALNAHFQQPQFNQTGAVWDEGCIRDRARDLFAVARNVWPHPAA